MKLIQVKNLITIFCIIYENGEIDRIDLKEGTYIEDTRLLL